MNTVEDLIQHFVHSSCRRVWRITYTNGKYDYFYYDPTHDIMCFTDGAYDREEYVEFFKKSAKSKRVISIATDSTKIVRVFGNFTIIEDISILKNLIAEVDNIPQFSFTKL